MAGIIPLIYEILHHIASLCFLSTLNNSSSCDKVKLEAIMTGRESLGPRKVYLRVSGRGLSSNSSGFDSTGSLASKRKQGLGSGSENKLRSGCLIQ